VILPPALVPMAQISLVLISSKDLRELGQDHSSLPKAETEVESPHSVEAFQQHSKQKGELTTKTGAYTVEIDYDTFFLMT
jgi:hypothetical protein